MNNKVIIWFKDSDNRWLILSILQWFTVLFIGGGICLNKSFLITSIIMSSIAKVFYCLVLGYCLFDMIKNFKRIGKENLVYMIVYHLCTAIWIVSISLYRGYYKPINEKIISIINDYIIKNNLSIELFTKVTIEMPSKAIAIGVSLLFGTLILSIVIYIVKKWIKKNFNSKQTLSFY